mgnify:CR=1 FL=1
MFSKEGFIEACGVAVKEGQAAVRELVQEAVSDPNGIIKELGEPKKAGIDLLHRSDDLTVINFIWSPYMTLIPHNHNMFAVIGLYNGREDNVFWKKTEDGLEAAGAGSLAAGTLSSLAAASLHLGEDGGAQHTWSALPAFVGVCAAAKLCAAFCVLALLKVRERVYPKDARIL